MRDIDALCCVRQAGAPQNAGTVCESDLDGDGVDGLCGDACPSDPTKLEPGLCGCGVSDVDTDGDGVEDCHDGCPNDPFKTSPGLCDCGIPDIDSDDDTVPDCNDQCEGRDDRIDEDNNGIPDCVEFTPTPATSAWGLVALGLTFAILAKLAFRARATT